MASLWFAIQAKPRKEALAEFHLKRQGFNVPENGLSVFFPHYRIAGWAPKGKYLADFVPKKAYLTGYLFVQAALEKLAPVYSTIGVSTIVGAGSPFAIPERLIDKLKALTKPDGEMLGSDLPTDEFPGKTGDKIRVKETNSLWGFYGAIKRVCPKHIVVELDTVILGQKEFSISKEDIEVIAAR